MRNIKIIFYYVLLLITVQFFSACGEDNDLIADPFVVAFESLSANLIEIESEQNIALIYSKTAQESGMFSIAIKTINAQYGVDFITIPEAINNTIEIPIIIGETADRFIFKKLNPFLDESTTIDFSITGINYPSSKVQGNTNFTLNASAALGGSFTPDMGGPNEGNQVYIDLSSQASTAVRRDIWDLGFYSGDVFRVTLNGSLYMAAASLEATDIDMVSESDVIDLKNQVAVGTFDPSNIDYIDEPNGDILETAIAEVSVNDAENQVYLVNLGYAIGTSIPTTGGVAIAGNQRGWKKIRILRREDKYLLQYADLAENTHQEITLDKDSNYNFSFFSFESQDVVPVEPEKERWDLAFTVFTNSIEDAGSYGFSDFVIHNRKGGVTAYAIEDIDYNSFTLDQIDPSLLQQDQTTIGSNWRDVFASTSYPDQIYILKDPNGNYYKIRFLALTNSNGERGYPEFEYQLLQ